MNDAKPLDDPCSRQVARAMQVWCFVGAEDLWALTEDEAGTNLPEEHGPWRRLKSILLTGSQPDEQEAEALIHEYGYCCFENHDAD